MQKKDGRRSTRRSVDFYIRKRRCRADGSVALQHRRAPRGAALSRPRVPVASVVPHNGNRVCSSREQVWVQYPRTGGPWARTSGVAPLVHISKSWAFLPAWPWASDASSAKDSSLSRLSRRSETVCPPNVQGLGLVQTSAACSAKSSRVRLRTVHTSATAED